MIQIKDIDTEKISNNFCMINASQGNSPCGHTTNKKYSTTKESQKNAAEVDKKVREAPLKKLQGLFGHCPNGGGGSKRLPEWFGALI